MTDLDNLTDSFGMWGSHGSEVGKAMKESPQKS